MVSNIVADLLVSNECVTIPGFGAFVVNPSSAQIDVAKNRFTPPGKLVSFNKNISNNDGLVANALAIGEGISYQDAVVYLRGFVQSIKEDLKAKGSFDFGAVGSFYLTAESLLKFEPKTLQSPFEIGLEAFHLTPLSNSSVVGKEEVNPTVEVQPQIKYVNALSSWGKVGWAVAALPLIAYLAWVPAQSGVLNKQKSFQFSDLNPFRTAPCEEYVPRPAGLTGLALNSENLLYTDFDETTYKFVVPETTNVVEVVVPEIATTKLRYQIIGGCFSQKSNANRMVSSLNKKGYSAEIYDKRNGLYRVSLGGYNSISDARKALRKIKANDNSSAWLLKN